jgi:hypothetical protein
MGYEIEQIELYIVYDTINRESVGLSHVPRRAARVLVRSRGGEEHRMKIRIFVTAKTAKVGRRWWGAVERIVGFESGEFLLRKARRARRLGTEILLRSPSFRAISLGVFPSLNRSSG